MILVHVCLRGAEGKTCWIDVCVCVCVGVCVGVCVCVFVGVEGRVQNEVC